jgi:hypothetical protein
VPCVLDFHGRKLELGFGFVLLANAQLDNLIDRLKATTGYLLLDQVFGLWAELNGHSCVSVPDSMSQIEKKGEAAHILILPSIFLSQI